MTDIDSEKVTPSRFAQWRLSEDQRLTHGQRGKIDRGGAMRKDLIDSVTETQPIDPGRDRFRRDIFSDRIFDTEGKSL